MEQSGFSQVVGHRRVIEHLQNAIRNKTVSHAYLFDGDDGAGKNLVANLLAATLQCEAGGTEPCGQCRSCLQMASGNQPDVFHITHEKSIISVDDIRTQLCEPMGIMPYSSPKKIFIIDEAEKMNEQAQNALLKTLEEPPAYGVILLLSNNSEVFLQTILSRVVRLPFLPAPHDDVVQFLMEKKSLPDYQAGLVAALSGDNPGKAVRLSESEEFRKRKEEVVSMMKGLHLMGAEKRSALAKELTERKAELPEYLDLMLVWVRDLLYYKAEPRRARLMFMEEKEAIAEGSERYSYETLHRFVAEIEELRAKLNAYVNPNASIWVMLSHMSEQEIPN